jgi:hypothetical protein
MERYFVIVERGHPELLRDLNAVFGHESEAEIILNRRSRQGWGWSGVDRRIPQDTTDLETQGFMVIQQL